MCRTAEFGDIIMPEGPASVRRSLASRVAFRQHAGPARASRPSGAAFIVSSGPARRAGCETLRKRVRSASRSRRFMQSLQCALLSSVRPILARQLRPGPTGCPRGAVGRFERLPRPTPEQDRAHDSRCTPRAARRAAHEVVPSLAGTQVRWKPAGLVRAACADIALAYLGGTAAGDTMP